MIESFIKAISSLQKKLGKTTLTLQILDLSKDIITNILPFYISNDITLLTPISTTQVINTYGIPSKCNSHVIDATVHFTQNQEEEKEICTSLIVVYIKGDIFNIDYRTEITQSQPSLSLGLGSLGSLASMDMGVEIEGTLSQYDIYEEISEESTNYLLLVQNAQSYLKQQAFDLY
jgi:hypothetical protein